MSQTVPHPAGDRGLRAADLLKRLQGDAADRDARMALAHASAIHDDELLDGLRRAGVTAATLCALEFVPAILVGWAEGSMSRGERDRLRALAALRGIGEGHAAWPLLLQWMLQPPTEPETRVLLGALFTRLDNMPVRQRTKRRQAILRDCEAVARASSHLLGGPKISRLERAALQAVEARLGA